MTKRKKSPDALERLTGAQPAEPLDEEPSAAEIARRHIADANLPSVEPAQDAESDEGGENYKRANFYLSPEILDVLDAHWLQLRRTLETRGVSKSIIVEIALRHSLLDGDAPRLAADVKREARIRSANKAPKNR